MLKPAMNEILKNGESCFSLVIAVSKRAREITDDVEAKKKDIIDRNGGKLPADLGADKYYLQSKAVKLAVEDFAGGRYKLVEKANIGLTSEA